MIEYLKQLIKFKTYEENPDKASEVKKLYDYILSNIPSVYKHEIIESNGYESLIIFRNKKEHSKFLLQGHIDVVPGKDKLFEAYEKDGKLYGRGAADMKFAAAVYIQILNDLAVSDIDFNVWFTSDEELGGLNGVSYILNEKKYTADICFLPDGTPGSFIANAKGVYHFEVKAKGIAAHGSQPWKGDNAIKKIIDFYTQLENLDLFDSKGKEWFNTINLGVIAGGNTTNQVPDWASAKIDIRFVDKDTLDIIRKEIDNLGKDLDINELAFGYPFQVDFDNDYTNKYIEIYKKYFGDINIVNDNGSSDTRFFSAKGISVIMCNPDSSFFHVEDENVDINSLNKYYDVLKEFLQKN